MVNLVSPVTLQVTTRITVFSWGMGGPPTGHYGGREMARRDFMNFSLKLTRGRLRREISGGTDEYS